MGVGSVAGEVKRSTMLEVQRGGKAVRWRERMRGGEIMCDMKEITTRSEEGEH